MFKLAAVVFTIQTCNVASNDLELALLFANEVSTHLTTGPSLIYKRYKFLSRQITPDANENTTSGNNSDGSRFFFFAFYILQV